MTRTAAITRVALATGFGADTEETWRHVLRGDTAVRAAERCPFHSVQAGARPLSAGEVLALRDEGFHDDLTSSSVPIRSATRQCTHGGDGNGGKSSKT